MLAVCLVTASINELVNLKTFELNSNEDDYRVIVVDEGDLKIRRRNDKILHGIPHEYFGPEEREDWFRKRFGSNYHKYASAIPEKCHAETSFGFLVAYEEQPDLVIELDDDVYPARGHDLVKLHQKSISEDTGLTVTAHAKWYNTIQNLKLNGHFDIFPRGHPYSSETRSSNYSWQNSSGESVLNMGLWVGNPDLDALTIVFYGGLDGRCSVLSLNNKRRKVTVGKDSYFAVCSMNTAFLPKITPAFYQLYMNCMGIDRFDDIWSGIFLKKITDHLGDKMSLGEPLVDHQKRPRNVFKDLEKELHGMAINEILWKMVNELDLNGKTYQDAYGSLAFGLERSLEKITNPTYRKFLQTQTDKMKLWLEITDRIK